MIPIQYKLIPIGTSRRSGIKLKGVRRLTSHDTGNPGSTAIQNVSYYIRSANEMSASAHLFVDDKEIICCIPLDEKAWGVRYNCTQDNILFGDDANDVSIQIELCYGGNIDNQKAYKNYVELMAFLCRQYGLNPLKNIDGHFQLDPARRTDPLGGLKEVGKDWNGFLKDVDNKVTWYKNIISKIKSLWSK